MAKQMIATALVSIVAALFASSASGQFDASKLYKADQGPYAIESVETVELEDEQRGKTLPLRITFPKTDQKCPLVVFSHGALGSKDGYQPLATHWAGHGYVCIQPTHEDSSDLLLPRERRDLQEVWKKWPSRPADVSFILDSLEEIERRVPQLREKIDRERIGVGGHSFGAHTSQLIGGVAVQDPLTGELHSFADKRATAILPISPQGTDQMFVPDSWKDFTRPVLMITGSHDDSPRTGLSHRWRLEAFEHSPPGEKYLVFIDGAQHGFGGIGGQFRFLADGTENPKHVAIVKSTTTAFWDAYLAHDNAAIEFLQSDRLSGATDKKARITVK